MRKMPIYAEALVSFVWLVDPRERLLEAFKREGERWLRVAAHGGDELARIEPFDAVELDLSALWAASPPVKNEGP